ncbi:hypothetical protein GF345_06445 [Candidatus Woesearchaeota archaeon]|nr:hypothetical protein [Candidatus Woesearchaeota archaeon]
MKHKLSISINEDVLMKIQERLKTRDFRNQSHLFEVAAARMLEDEDGQ